MFVNTQTTVCHPHNDFRSLTKERHTGGVDGLEFGQVLLEVILTQFYSFL